ncbi:MAG: hypothetical protein KDE20_12310 [Caldilineaceae bacterium]|nr:hypothetical protein [Caldilineaceae bacterium]
MGKRHEAIGIKQAIRFEWMQKAANLLLAGLDAKIIRQELHDFLTDKKGNGIDGERSQNTRTFVVNNLMKIWISPAPELISLRDASLVMLQKHPSEAVAVHWGLISAVYPFWFNVARQAGRLLALQEQVTQVQIINRLKEQYGDRETIFRYGRYVLRSFVSWGVLIDSEVPGNYEKAEIRTIEDQSIATLMLEAGLMASAENKIALGMLIGSPAFFPFRIPHISGALVTENSNRIEVLRYGLDEELLKLK